MYLEKALLEFHFAEYIKVCKHLLFRFYCTLLSERTKYFFFLLLLYWILTAMGGLSLVALSRHRFLVVALRLLTELASVVAENEL